MKPRTLLIVASLALAAVAPAQGRGGMGMMRMMRSGSLASAMVLNRDDVQEEIKLTDAQKGKLDSQRASMRERMRSAFMQMRSAGGDPGDMQKTMQTTMTTLFESMSKEALSILTEAQRKRLGEIAIQSQGTMAVLQPELSQQLGMTAAQKAKIDDLQRRLDEANGGLFEQVREGTIDREQMTESMQKNSKTMDEEIAKIMTSAQKEKLKKLSGEPFEFKDPKPGTPGSWGRPGR